MSEHAEKPSESPPGGIEDHRKHPHKVQVTVDNHKHEVLPGSYIVSAFKAAVHVNPSKELDQIVDGVLKPLADDATIVIAGGETFVSHERTGGAS